MERRLRLPYWRLDYDRGHRLIRVARTREPFASLAALEESIAELSLVLDGIGRDSFALLVDLRDGPMRTDPAFEQAMADLRPKLLRGISPIAVLVATPLGAMQVSRHQRRGAIGWATFNDEAAALQHLRARRATATA